MLNSGQQSSKLHVKKLGPWIKISTIQLHSIKKTKKNTQNKQKKVKKSKCINVFHTDHAVYIPHTYDNTVMTCQHQALKKFRTKLTLLYYTSKAKFCNADLDLFWF